MSERKPQIDLAPTDALDALGPYVDRVLDALGQPDALATDESRVAHFLDSMGWDGRVSLKRGIEGRHGPYVERKADPAAAAENERVLRECREKLRVPVDEADLIVDVARRLRALGSA